jgi:hypothetical protein
MDEGWTRFVFDREAGVAYETLHDQDVRRGSLSSRFDVIILPDQTPRQIVSGNAPGSLPDEYVGGIGKDGVEALQAFVVAGGTLVTLNAASLLPLAEMGVPVTNVAPEARRPGVREDADEPESDGFYCPGAILRVKPDLAHPLAHGLEDPSVVWFEARGPARQGTHRPLRLSPAVPRPELGHLHSDAERDLHLGGRPVRAARHRARNRGEVAPLR